MTTTPIPATTKLAQTATGRKTCQRCGRTHPLDTWPTHARWKKPLNICGDCLTEARAEAGRKSGATRAAKTAERRQREQVASANAAAAGVPSVAVATTTDTTVPLLLAKLEGYALGKDDIELGKLVRELRNALDGR